MERVLLHDAAKSAGGRTSGETHPNLLSAICYLLFHPSLLARMRWSRHDLFGDVRVRYGIKVALAGLLSLFCAQLLRLPSANWAIVTVIALMRPQFVGSSAFKSIMRMAGTVGGATIGVWLIGDFISTPAILLPILFLGDCDRALPSFAGALAGLDQATRQMCDRAVLADQNLAASLQVLDLIDRYHAIGDSLAECGARLKILQMRRYWGDYFL